MKYNKYFIKDNLCCSLTTTTASSNFLNEFYSGYDSTLIKILEQYNFFFEKKTILDELSCGGTGLLSNTGVLRNPINDTRIVGGSSSGSALSAFENKDLVSIGSDTGGSVLIPASYVGVFGLKPGYGKVSRFGLIAFSFFIDTLGFLSQNLFELENIFNLLDLKDYNDLWTFFYHRKIKKNQEKKRFIFLSGIEEFMEPNLLKCYKEKINDLILLGFSCKKFFLPDFIKKHLNVGWINLCFSELISHLNSFQGITFGPKGDIDIKKKRDILGKEVKKRLLIGNYILKFNSKILLETYVWRNKVESWLIKKLKENDFCLMPTSICEAPLIESFLNSPLSLNLSCNWFDNLVLINNIARTPVVTVPFCLINKMPVGISIIGDFGSESKILNYAKLLKYKEND